MFVLTSTCIYLVPYPFLMFQARFWLSNIQTFWGSVQSRSREIFPDLDLDLSGPRPGHSPHTFFHTTKSNCFNINKYYTVQKSVITLSIYPCQGTLVQTHTLHTPALPLCTLLFSRIHYYFYCSHFKLIPLIDFIMYNIYVLLTHHSYSAYSLILQTHLLLATLYFYHPCYSASSPYMPVPLWYISMSDLYLDPSL